MLPNIKEIQEGSYYVVMFGAEKKNLNVCVCVQISCCLVTKLLRIAEGFIQFLLMWIVPGHEHKGPIAPSVPMSARAQTHTHTHTHRHRQTIAPSVLRERERETYTHTKRARARAQGLPLLPRFQCTHTHTHTHTHTTQTQTTHTHTHTQGHVPVYKANGVQCFLLTIVLWAVGAYLKLFPAGWQYTCNICKLD